MWWIKNTRDFEHRGHRYRVTLGSRHGPIQRVVIACLSELSRKPLGGYITTGSLRRMTSSEFGELLLDAEYVSTIPSAQDAIVLHRNDTQLAITRGEWNILRALAHMCKWEPAISWQRLSDGEACELAEGFADLKHLAKTHPGDTWLMLPSDEILAFLANGGFEVTELGESFI